MNKKTKMYVGIGLVAVAAYLIYKKMQDKKTTDESNTPQSFVGNRRRMVGVNAEVGSFYDVQNSGFTA